MICIHVPIWSLVKYFLVTLSHRIKNLTHKCGCLLGSDQFLFEFMKGRLAKYLISEICMNYEPVVFYHVFICVFIITFFCLKNDRKTNPYHLSLSCWSRTARCSWTDSPRFHFVATTPRCLAFCFFRCSKPFGENLAHSVWGQSSLEKTHQNRY